MLKLHWQKTSGSHKRPLDGRRRQLDLQSLEARQLMAADVIPTESIVALVDKAEGEVAPMADFSLVDVNPNSTTYNDRVSPRQFIGQMSAWYFGHAT